MCGHTRGPVIYSKFHRNPLGVSEPQGVKIWPFPLLWLVAFTTACTTVQAVIVQDLLSSRKRGNMFLPALVCLCVCVFVCDHNN